MSSIAYSKNHDANFLEAVRARNIAQIKQSLKNGANIEVIDYESYTALMRAAYEGHTEIVEILLNHGANIEETDHNGWTALMNAAYEGHTETVEAL